MKNYQFRNGLGMLLGFTAFFFLMKGLGLYTDVNFRSLNFLIHGAFIFLAIRKYRSTQNESFNWLATFLVGIRTSILPIIGFSIFQFIYLQFIDPAFMIEVKATALMGGFLTPALASVWLIFEGLGVSIFVSYLTMRYFTVQEKVPSLSKESVE